MKADGGCRRPGECSTRRAQRLAAADAQFDARAGSPRPRRSAHRGHEQLAEAYLRAQPSRRREGRAVWNHSGTGAYPGDWDRSARLLARNGFNMVLPNMLWAGQAHYPSDVLPRSETFRQVWRPDRSSAWPRPRSTAWKSTCGRSITTSPAPARSSSMAVAPPGPHAGLRRRPAGGLALPFAPGKPAARIGEHVGGRPASIASTACTSTTFAIRTGSRCYCDGCRRRFEADSGRRVADWPAGLLQRPAARTSTTTGACRQITLLVAASSPRGEANPPRVETLRGRVRRLSRLPPRGSPRTGRPGSRPDTSTSFAPWTIHRATRQFAWLGAAASEAGRAGAMPIYAGIGATASSSALSADRVVGQIHACPQFGRGRLLHLQLRPWHGRLDPARRGPGRGPPAGRPAASA